jgi:hypothetical protein
MGRRGGGKEERREGGKGRREGEGKGRGRGRERRNFSKAFQGKTSFFASLCSMNKYLNSDIINQYYAPASFRSQ